MAIIMSIKTATIKRISMMSELGRETVSANFTVAQYVVSASKDGVV